MLTREFVRALPKAELHLHLEGAVPWAMVRAHSTDGLPASPPWSADGFRFEDFTEFRGAVQTCMGCLVDARAYGAVTGAIVLDMRAQNARYVEISFDVVRVLDKRLEIADVVGAMKAAAPPGVVVRVFAAFSQHKPERTPAAVIETVLAAPGLDGISLHGDETAQSTAYFADAFAEARRHGLLTKAHAGELLGPESVVKALDLLGVPRIEHGVRAIEDDALVERLAADGVTLDVCPWSNVRLRVVRDLTAHPIRRLHARGVRLTVNTDDPTVFGRTLSQEIASLVDDLGFSPAEVARLQANAFAVAAMPAAARDAVLGEIEALAREIGPGKA
jgi:adenosine deaminase